MPSSPLLRIVRAVAGALVLFHASAAQAASGTWTPDANGDWSTATNWTGGTIADGKDGNASFSNNITADRTVTLNTGRVIGGLTFGDANTATPGGWSLTGTGSLSLQTTSGSPVLSVNALAAGKAATITVPLTSTAAAVFTKTGAGTLILSAANTFPAGTMNFPATTTDDSGVVRLTNNAALGSVTTILEPGTNAANSCVELAGNITVPYSIDTAGRANSVFLRNVSGANTLSGTLRIANSGGNYAIESAAGTLTLSGSVYNSIPTSRTLAFIGAGNGIISGFLGDGSGGVLSIDKQGTGTWTLAAPNAYTGTTTISGGTLQWQSSINNSTSIVDNATLAFTSPDGINLTQVISGTGAVVQKGAGSLTLSGANTYAGGTQTTTAGTHLSVNNDSALGTGLVTLGDTLGSAQVWFQSAGSQNLANNFEVRTARWIIDSTTVNNLAAGDLTISGSVYLNQGAAGRDIYTNKNLTLSGQITGTIGLTKSGDSTLTISGAASYTGTTTVNDGALYVDGSLTGGGAVNVASGGTFGGTGTVSGVVTMNGTSTIAVGRPTSGTGKLTVGGLVLNAGSSIIVGLGAPGAPTNGSFQVNGKLTLGGTLTVINTGAITTGTYPLFNYTGTLTNLGVNVALDAGLSGTLVTTAGQVSLRVTKAQALGPMNTEMISFADLSSLRWYVDPAAQGYNVYFGTSASAVSAATTSTAGVYQGRSTTGTYTPTGLTAPATSTTYYWRTDTVNADGSITAGPVWSFTVVNDRDMLADTWVATDALNRVLPTSVESGPPRPNQPIGIFYFLWHNPNSLGSDGPRDVSAYINGRNGYTTATNPWADSPPWMTGSSGRSWYWGQPEAGYYTNDDEWVIRRHLALLSAAGVDVVAFDNTNGNPQLYQANYTAIANTLRKMRAEGTKINIKFMFITHTGSPVTMTWLYDNLYRPGLYPELWYQWQGKPVIIGYPDGLTSSDGSVSSTVRNFFTIRAGWANGSNPVNEWQWIDTPTPQSVGYVTGRPDIAEQIPVAAGGWANSNLGRSNANRTQPAFDKFHLSLNRTEGQGLFFSEQMYYGLKIDPQFLFVTGWNEWWAGAWDSPYNGYTNLLTMPVAAANRYFVDNYDAEYSRDIEPMKGGFGDNYYYQLVAQNRLRKGARPVPMASAAKTIAVGGDFSDWTTVGPEFLDVVGDVAARNHATTFSNLANYTNTTGRNDFRVLKVARDNQYLYFYAETVAPITTPSGTNWMTLFIDADRSRATGWEGYDYVINFGGVGTSTTTLQRLAGSTWAPTVVRSDLFYKVTGNKLMLRVARADLGLSADPLTFDFHWADNYQKPGDISEFGVNGDSAPDRRFNYRYQTWTEQPTVLRQDGFENGQDASWGETYASGSRWKISSTLPYSGNACLLGTGSSNASAPSVMINRTSTAASTSMQVSFRYKLGNVADAQNIQVSYLNASNVWVKARELSRDEYYSSGQAWSYDERQNVWLLFNDTLTNSGSDAQFFHDKFAVKIDIAGLTSSTQTVVVDDFQINATQRTGVATATTAPNTAAGGAMSNNKILRWTPGTGASTQSVYLGTPGNLRLVATLDGAAGSFDPGTLQFGTQYAWRVDAVNTYGTTVGQSWSFTTAVQPKVTPAGFDSGRHFQLTIAGDVGPDYLVEGSNDLISWQTLKTYSAPVPPIVFVDADSGTATKRFYRIRLGP